MAQDKRWTPEARAKQRELAKDLPAAGREAQARKRARTMTHEALANAMSLFALTGLERAS